MKQLNKLQSILYAVGGALMVIGAGCFAFMWQQRVVCWLYLAGATLFCLMQSMQTYEGTDFVVRRLKRIQAVQQVGGAFAHCSPFGDIHHAPHRPRNEERQKAIGPDMRPYLVYIGTCGAQAFNN